MPFDNTKSTSQQILITTQKKLDQIIALKVEQEGLKLTRPTLLELLVTQELKRIKKAS